MSKFKATGIVSAAFDADNIRYHLEQHSSSESVCAGFSVPKGPLVDIHFISRDNDNDVAVRVLGLFNDVPKADWPKLYPVINQANSELRYIKFCLDGDGDVNVEYDIPVKCEDDSLGPMACELFYRMASAVRAQYVPLATALYAEPKDEDEDDDEDDDDDGSFADLMRMLSQSDVDDDDDDDDEDDSDDGDAAAEA